MDLNEIAIFVRVVAAGSFSGAARALGMPNSTVSSKISALEKRLGITLIQRTTRKLSVTPAGRAYYDRCLRGLSEFEEAESELLAGRSEPAGTLRLTAPTELGNSILPALIPYFLNQYPKVAVEVWLTDRRVDLVEEHVDLAIRAGELKDSSLIARKVGHARFGLFASAKYLKTRGLPKKPADLGRLDGIRFQALGPGPWRLNGPTGKVSVDVPSRLSFNDLSLIKSLVVAGAGVALLPTFYCSAEARAGKVVHVLPTWTAHVAPVQFVYPAQRFVPPRLSAFIQFSAARIGKLLGEDSST